MKTYDGLPSNSSVRNSLRVCRMARCFLLQELCLLCTCTGVLRIITQIQVFPLDLWLYMNRVAHHICQPALHYRRVAGNERSGGDAGEQVNKIAYYNLQAIRNVALFYCIVPRYVE